MAFLDRLCTWALHGYKLWRLWSLVETFNALTVKKAQQQVSSQIKYRLTSEQMYGPCAKCAFNFYRVAIQYTTLINFSHQMHIHYKYIEYFYHWFPLSALF